MTKIKDLRLNKNYTQQQLAEFVGVTQAAINMWENGKAMPTSDKLPLLANTLGCSITDLFGM